MDRGEAMSGDLTKPGGALALRASHADRDRVVDVLSRAAGDGLLSAEELDERVEAALTARTRGELAALTADLPALSGVLPAAVKDVARIEQRGASVRRGDGWVVPRRLEIDSSLGEVTLDFTHAVLTESTLRIDLDMSHGALRLMTRPGIVIDADSLVTEFADVRIRPAGRPETPVVLRVEIAGRLSHGRVLARPPRRRLLRRTPKP
ncbi:DUF1707 domain-containing protein [Streptomyces sp. NPDC005423]|uniref:DUF1707 SHOCT-like domain-containing protein n=1 Tax=Streptomyces sp. NPDC005423 TaxID=3155343 RepID=UPI0033B8E81E